jgi:hypothetical protein
MDDLITRIRELARETDDAGRLNIQDALRGLQYELESPYETLLRISAQVRTHLLSCCAMGKEDE